MTGSNFSPSKPNTPLVWTQMDIEGCQVELGYMIFSWVVGLFFRVLL
jgi:hypothetical protein